MSSLPYLSLFSFTLILGSLLALSGNHWIFIWMGLEVNLMSFIPLLTSSHMNQEAEAAMKYFLAQALGSGLLLLGALSFSTQSQLTLPFIFSPLLITFGLLIKLGLPPCHFWFPSVMGSISWPLCIALATWQKLIPLLLLLYTFSAHLLPLICFIVMFSSLIGGLGGLNQTQLRPLLAFSSIGHMSWMLAASTVSYSAGLMYYLIYVLITIPLMLMLWINSTPLTSSLNSLSFKSKSALAGLMILVLSLGGVPPFTGFFPKWVIMESLASTSPFLVTIILLGSMINLYYYLNLMFISSIKASSPDTLLSSPSTSFSFMPLLAGGSLGLGPVLFMII
uniref:NADH-ubiquinone oxidoreductase chain 2 n=1 Tax=Melaenis sp. YZ-2018 TaxID=2153335 RepID=A0A343W690_9ANNE|nr:NADH dehydrogenase subunit 2 [Melaenis sp. YZ-2018]